jgi:flagellar hook assembly protein FlgD
VPESPNRMHDPSAVAGQRQPPVARAALRALALVALVLSVALTAVVGDLVAPASAAVRVPHTGAEDGPGSPEPRRAVVVVGPVGNQTDKWLEQGRAVARAAERNGMSVTRIFHPKATWKRVVNAAQGAHLFVYLGHGNGWPSPYGPFQEDTKNGLGLNPTLNETNAHKVRYFGANRIRESIRFAPSAIVILNKLCYAAGNGEDHHPIPTRSVARQRVDNFASGFLAVGARAVFALSWQAPGTIIDALHAGPATMDDLFMRRFGGSAHPANGWVGWRPSLYFDSARTPGARLHLDQDPNRGYLRALTGDLGLTTTEWLGSASPPPPPPADTTPPVLTEVSANRASNTIVAGDGGAAVFTPNGDGLSDKLTIVHRLSEPATLKLDIERVKNGNIVRRMTVARPAGRSTTVWNGRRDSGDFVLDGRYRIHITPRDKAGNVGETVIVAARVLTALKAPTAAPRLFDSTDGDDIGSTTFSAPLTKAADISWEVVAPDGRVVRTGMLDERVTSGATAFTWDGLDDDGRPVARGTYTGRVSATTDNGTYAHETSVRVMPFLMTSSRAVLRRGQKATLTITAAEPVKGKPAITVKQPGLPAYRLKVRKANAKSFSADLVPRRGGRVGNVRVTIASTDRWGGTQQQRYVLTLR